MSELLNLASLWRNSMSGVCQQTKRRQSVIWLGFKASESFKKDLKQRKSDDKLNEIFCVSRKYVGHWAKIHPSWCSALLASQWEKENSYSHTSSNDFLVEINWMKFVFSSEEELACIVGMEEVEKEYFYHFCKKNGKVFEWKRNSADLDGEVREAALMIQ